MDTHHDEGQMLPPVASEDAAMPCHATEMADKSVNDEQTAEHASHKTTSIGCDCLCSMQKQTLDMPYLPERLAGEMIFIPFIPLALSKQPTAIEAPPKYS